MTQIAQRNQAPQSRRPMVGDELTPAQQQAVNWFFRRLKLVNGEQYDRLLPSAEAVKDAKRDYAVYIKDFSRPQIDAGFDRLHLLRQQGDLSYRFLDIDQVIGLVQMAARVGVYSPRSGKFYIPEPDTAPKALPDKGAEERNRKAGREALDDLLGGFGEAC